MRRNNRSKEKYHKKSTQNTQLYAVQPSVYKGVEGSLPKMVDEPTSALDPISTSKIEDLAMELKKRLYDCHGYA